MKRTNPSCCWQPDSCERRASLSPQPFKLAEAAAIEEELSERCVAAGLREKAWVHLFSAASSWAQAGNFYQAITLCDHLLAQPDLPERLRGRVRDYANQIRARRAQWYADLALATAGAEG